MTQPNMKGDYQICQVCLDHIRRARPLPTMSSSSISTPSASTPSTRPTPKTNSQADGGSAFGSSGVTNYFFGFLFLFAVILLILIGCGIGTRRRLLSRRTIPLTSLEPWSLSGPRGEITPPKFHESRIVVGHETDWKDTMPLSVVYLADEHDLNEKSATDNDDVEVGHSRRGMTTTTSDQPPTSFPTFPFLPTLRKNPTSSNSKVAARPTTAIRVVILVAMPSPREDHRGSGADDQHVEVTTTGFSSETNLLKKAPEEIQIGVETLPWRES